MTTPNTGNSGNPNPASGAAPANQPNPAAPGQAQPQPGGGQQPASAPQGGQPPAPGASGDEKTVPLAALQEERDRRQALQAELDQVRQYVQGMQQQQPNGGTAYNAPQSPQNASYGTNNAQREQIERLWETDPREAVRAEISNSLATYDTINAQVEAQANQLASRYPDFNNYRQTAMNYIRTLPYSQRAQNGIVELAYMVARGQNVDTLLQSREQELMEKFKTGQMAGGLHTPAGAGGTPRMPQGDITLSPEQQAAAAAMGMSPQEYAANMKA